MLPCFSVFLALEIRSNDAFLCKNMLLGTEKSASKWSKLTLFKGHKKLFALGEKAFFLPNLRDRFGGNRSDFWKFFMLFFWVGQCAF